jgi:hypothetical protein
MTVGSTVAKRQLADRPPSRGGILDARSSVGRRRRELIRVYTEALGGPSALTEGQLIDIRKAAELVALSEQARARAMQEGTGGAGELSAMVRLESTAARAVRGLGIKPAQPKRRTLAEYLANRPTRPADVPNGGAT